VHIISSSLLDTTCGSGDLGDFIVFYQGLPQLARHHEEGPGDEVATKRASISAILASIFEPQLSFQYIVEFTGEGLLHACISSKIVVLFSKESRLTKKYLYI
jgi:hypothetical protein